MTDIRRAQILEDLAGDDKLRYDSDIKDVNILLLGLPINIYTLINHYQTAKEIWNCVKELMEGTEMTKQESEYMLYDEFDKFTSEPGDLIHSYYLRFAKLINDLNMIPMPMTPMQINMKFVNHLQPEWIQNGQVTVKNVQGRQSQGYAGNAGNNQASGARVINAVGNTGANQPRVIRCYNCNGEAQEAGVVLTEEKHDFLADSLKETGECEDLQLQATTNFKADHVDAYDSDCDDEATANAIFMENLSPIGSLNDDTVALCYDSDTLSEVPHYNTYHDSDVLNSNIQELGYIENIVSNNDSYDELKGNSDVISYTDYMLTIRDSANNYVPPPIQKNDMMLSVIEQIKSQVEKCSTVNQEAKSVNESLTSELERYKDRVRVLEYALKDGHSEQEAYLSPQQKQPALYNGNVLIAKHNPVTVCDSEETLILAEESRLKMLEKQNVVNTKPIDYSKLNKLYEIFVPQTQLSAEQLFWSSIPSPPVTVSKPKVFPKKLPSTSQVLRNLNNARDLLTKFDECIKRRTTLSPHKIGSREQSDIKGAFKADLFSKNLKETFKQFKKEFIIEVKEMKVIFEQMEDKEYLQESNKSLFELRKRFAKLKEYIITLDIAFQNHKEQMILNAPEMKNKQFFVKTINNQSVEINDLKVQLQDKLYVINKLKHLLAQKSQKTQCELPDVDSRIQKIKDENVSLAFQVSSFVKEREHIKLEYKKFYDSIKQTRAETKLQIDSLQQKLNE
ncbi:hypothetical protein Tco_0656661 [Tanacetum coccineum]|uniref:Integrase, catalytic region, zinc finger, CCHC-type, peptidase aspartic, catalytic n=1 Tax=Tanacetum coccineum TaxID=301880 RepID=A0ABQ4X9D2_9ASTR